METLLYLLYMAAGRAPMIPLDEALRPTRLFGTTVADVWPAALARLTPLIPECGPGNLSVQ
jgi:hypothetical protein